MTFAWKKGELDFTKVGGGDGIGLGAIASGSV
jgi:hypothetical protein